MGAFMRCSQSEEKQKNCFSITKRGVCVALEDTEFHGKACPFYKSRKQASEEWEKYGAPLCKNGKPYYKFPSMLIETRQKEV